MSTDAEEYRPDLVGDGWDPEPLMTAEQVAEYLQVPKDAVYDLAIPRVRIGQRRVRWRPDDVRAFIEDRLEA